MSTDAIVILKADHKELRKTFRAFEAAGDNATVRKGQLVATMTELLTRFGAKTTVHEIVTHHIEEEEWFPKVRAGLGRRQLGARMLDAKASAPASPAQPSALKKTIDAVIN